MEGVFSVKFLVLRIGGLGDSRKIWWNGKEVLISWLKSANDEE